MKCRRTAVLLFLPLLSAASNAQEDMSPQLSANLVLDLTTDVQGSNAVIYAPGIRDVLFFAYLGAAGHTFDELGEVLSLQSSVPGESIRVELPSPGVPNRILWIQEDYP